MQNVFVLVDARRGEPRLYGTFGLAGRSARATLSCEDAVVEFLFAPVGGSLDEGNYQRVRLLRL